MNTPPILILNHITGTIPQMIDFELSVTSKSSSPRWTKYKFSLANKITTMFAESADLKQLSTAAIMAPLIVSLLKDRFAPFQFILPMAVQACDKLQVYV